MARVNYILQPARRGGLSKACPFGALYNHEVWRVCANCGNWIDVRLNGLECDECGFKNEI